jgi:hypothetical protein
MERKLLEAVKRFLLRGPLSNVDTCETVVDELELQLLKEAAEAAEGKPTGPPCRQCLSAMENGETTICESCVYVNAGPHF